MFRVCFAFCVGLATAFAAPVWAATTAVTGRAHVIDGDTIDVQTRSGEQVRIRIHGIDAPEVTQICETGFSIDWACGEWASQQLRERIEGRFIECQQTDYDTRYDRLVAACFLDGTDIGQALVQDGVAFAYRKYSWDYDLDEKAAAMRDAGLHGFRVQSPEQFRRARIVGRFPLDPACPIKGNISANGHIYHMPDQHYYARTGVRPDKGEKWFCSEIEAIRAGWRRALR